MIKYEIVNDTLYAIQSIDYITERRYPVITKEAFIIAYEKWIKGDDN